MAIYDAYFQCQREPFSLNPDPRFLYLTPRHREAFAQLRYVACERKGFAVMTGEVGTGKTTLLRRFLEGAGPDMQTGYIFNPPRTSRELESAISRELALGWSEPEPFLAHLNDFLLESLGRNKVVVLIFDEAQALGASVLEEIRLLSNLETGSAKLLQIVLAGQPEFNAMLDSAELRALRQRVALRCNLEPMDAEETVEYIGTRLRIAGARRSPFTLEACRAIHDHSHGIPRLINLLCDNAMLLAYASDSPFIGKAMVEQAAEDLGLKTRPAALGTPAGTPEENPAPRKQPTRRTGYWAAAAVTFGCVVAAATWLVISGTGQRLYARRDALMDRFDSFVARVIDGPVDGTSSGYGADAPAGASHRLPIAGGDPRNGPGANNE